MISSSRPRQVLTTVHGSHLYGLARPDSDLDVYTVVCDDSRRNHVGGRVRPNRQTTDGERDTNTVDLDTFLRLVAEGRGQTLEALWSPVATVDPVWAPFLAALRPSVQATIYAHTGAIMSFGSRHGRHPFTAYEDIPVKQRRNMLRVAVNLWHFYEHGWYNPRLTPSEVTTVCWAAEEEAGFFERFLRTLCPVRLGTFTWSSGRGGL